MPQQSFLHSQRIPLAITVVAVVAAAFIGGPKAAVLVALLAMLEVSISFDNAIVNAHVLKGMTAKWQQIFLTWGILIAVFGMRLVFPIGIVAVAAGLPVGDVVSQALNDPGLYAENLEAANATIAGFGGAFLLMVFLAFFLDPEKEHHWAGALERPMASLGRIPSMPAAITGLAVIVISQVVDASAQQDVLLSGLAGIVTHLFVSGLASSLEPDEDEDEVEEHDAATLAAMTPERRQALAAATAAAAKGGFASFMYLEVLDASFSFDGVIGAFAISKDVVIIAVGLGIGALFIRTLTVYLVRQGTLAQYRYLEHGAHWAIGVLAVLLFVGIEAHPPEVVTGSLGILLIGLSLWSSLRANKRDAAQAPAEKDELVAV